MSRFTTNGSRATWRLPEPRGQCWNCQMFPKKTQAHTPWSSAIPPAQPPATRRDWRCCSSRARPWFSPRISTASSWARLSPTASRVATALTGPQPPRLAGPQTRRTTTGRPPVATMWSSLMDGHSLILCRGMPRLARRVGSSPRAPAWSPWATRTSTTTRPTPSSTHHWPPRRSASRASIPVRSFLSTTRVGGRNRRAAR